MITVTAFVLGFLLDLVFGDPHYRWHPICLIGNLIAFLEKRIRNILPKTKRGEFIGGAVLVILVLIVSTVIPFGILFLCQWIHPILRLVVESLMTWQILATNSLKVERMKVYKALVKHYIEESRYQVSRIVGRDTKRLNDIGITKAAIETVAENTSDGVIAPMIALALLGPVAGFAYKAVNTMDSMVGYTNDTYLYFGRVAAKLDDLVNWIPARISALLLIAVSVGKQYSQKNAWVIFKRDRYKHASPNSAQTESACAGALRIMLAGDAWYHGVLHKKEFIGDPIREVEYEDIKRVNVLMIRAALLCFFLCLVIKLSLVWI